MELKELLQVKEDYQVPDKLMSVLLDDAKRPELFKHFEKEDLKRDFLREYFETNQADRKNFMQDFTPDCVGEIVRGIIGNTDSVLDVCSGTGGLSTKAWADNPNAEFRCEEYSEAALPFTLFNMAIRNVNGHVVHENVLTREIKAIYKLSKGEKYSSIELELIDEEQPVSVAVTNPPYSQKWENINEYKDDVRFKEYGLPPKSKADFAFLLHAYSKIKEHGILVAILPHGVLFRGAAEGSIRQRLVETGAIETIIGLPENLFTNTSIPTVLLIMRRDRANKDIYFIDASKRFVKKKNINEMTEEHIKEVLTAYHERKDIDKFAAVTNYEKLIENDFNLNIPRYVDSYEPEYVPDIVESMRKINEINHEMRMAESDLLEMLEEMRGTSVEAERKLQQLKQEFKIYVEESCKRKVYEPDYELLSKKQKEEIYVKDVAEIERSRKGKKYAAGSVLIALSAVSERDFPTYIKEEQEVDSRYAVIQFKIPCIPLYIYQSVCAAYPEFAHKYLTGMNFQIETLNHLKICLHDLQTQQEMANDFMRMQATMEGEQKLLEKFEDIKKAMLELMFP